MRVTIHQPEHLPWLGYLHKMAQADLYVVLDNVQYRHRYFQNRNRILGAEGPAWVAVPVRNESHRYGLIHDVHIDNDRDWRKSYWGSIMHRYGHHPFFDRYGLPLRDLVMTPGASLCDLNMSLIEFFRSAFDIRTPLIRSSELGVEGAKSDLILAICEETCATHYLSGPYGRDYLDAEEFERWDIALEFHEFSHPTYPQKGTECFVENLSALDLLMNCGSEAKNILFLEPKARLNATH